VIQKLHHLKAERDNEEVKKALNKLDREVRLGKNSVPALLECVKAYATIAEMCQVLGHIWGHYQEGSTWI
jgi:methylmalonyl-CoA mutase N-terminal domain/subunit